MESRVDPDGGGDGDTSGKAAGVAPAPPSVAAGPAGPAGAWSPCWRSTAEPTHRQDNHDHDDTDRRVAKPVGFPAGVRHCAVMGLPLHDA